MSALSQIMEGSVGPGGSESEAGEEGEFGVVLVDLGGGVVGEGWYGDGGSETEVAVLHEGVELSSVSVQCVFGREEVS